MKKSHTFVCGDNGTKLLTLISLTFHMRLYLFIDCNSVSITLMNLISVFSPPLKL